MASPLNTFKSLAVNVTTTAQTIYTVPAQTTTIVLLAQAVNVSPSVDANITFFTSLNSNTELCKDFTIPPQDAAGLLTGKLVIEAGQSLGCVGSANNVLKLTLSILETK